MEEYLHKPLVLSLHGFGKPMEDDDFVICLLRGLGPESEPIVATLDEFPPLENVMSKLRDFEL